MNFTDLTKKQKRVVKFMLVMNGCGALTARSLLCDNFSCKWLREIAYAAKMSKHVLSGVLGSLCKAGIISVEDRSEEDGGDFFWIEESFLSEMDEKEKDRPFAEYE